MVIGLSMEYFVTDKRTQIGHCGYKSLIAKITLISSTYLNKLLKKEILEADLKEGLGKSLVIENVFAKPK